VISNDSEASGEREIGKGCASVEDEIFECVEVVGQLDVGERGTARKGIGVDLGDGRGRVSVTSETQNVNVPISTEVRRFGKAMSVSEEQP